MAASNFGAAVELGQLQQAAQMDAGLQRTTVQLQVKRARLRSPGVELALQRLLAWALAERQRCQAVLRQHQQLAAFVTADVLSHDLTFVH